MLQLPQWASVFVVLTSQPFVTLLSQLAKDALQTIAQAPAAQDAVAFGRAGHGLSQRPQWAVLLAVFTHAPPQRVSVPAQPLAQRFIEHTGVGPEQLVPQAPQFISVSSRASQPLPALRSQSAKPEAQVSAQLPIAHAGVALAAAGQRLPQAPQFIGSVCVFAMHTPPSTPVSTRASISATPLSMGSCASGEPSGAGRSSAASVAPSLLGAVASPSNGSGTTSGRTHTPSSPHVSPRSSQSALTVHCAALVRVQPVTTKPQRGVRLTRSIVRRSGTNEKRIVRRHRSSVGESGEPLSRASTTSVAA